MTSYKSNHSIRNLYTHAYSYCLKLTALLRSILEDIREIDIRKQNSLESTRDLILIAGQTAPAEWFRIRDRRVVQIVDDTNAVVEQQRDLFCEYIKSLTKEYLDLPLLHNYYFDLPHLHNYYHICMQESDEIAEKIFKKWGRWYGGSRREISSNESTEDITFNKQSIEYITFNVGIFIDDREHEEFPAKKTYQDLINILTSNGIKRVYEIGEGELHYELDINDAIDNFERSEKFWTNTELDFLIYSSHEDTITFGGKWLVDEVKKICPYWQDHFYW